jgi:[acyl-carrier-protein] S-malonyltransferase
MSRLAFMFPGQGSQYVGMGKAIANAYPVAKQVFQEADEILQYPISSMCFEGPEDDLFDTANAQPAIFVTSVTAWHVLQSQLDGLAEPLGLAGHSLGEYTALFAAGVMDFSDALKLVRARGLAMKYAGEVAPGGMLAVIGLQKDLVQEMIHDAEQATDAIIEIANDNCPGQIVVAGEWKALDCFAEICAKKKTGMVNRLNVTVAPHTSLMQPAIPGLLETLDTVSLNSPQIPVVANTTGQWLRSTEDVYNELRDQLIKSVLWVDSIHRLTEAGIDTFVELGPGKALTGLMRRINRQLVRANFGDDPENLTDVLHLILSHHS